MRALITGGAGFIGSHLAEACIANGWNVSDIDDLSTGSIRNKSELKSNPAFSYTIGTIFDAPLVAELVDEADIVYHLAAAVGVRLIVEKPVYTIETNVQDRKSVV